LYKVSTVKSPGKSNSVLEGMLIKSLLPSKSTKLPVNTAPFNKLAFKEFPERSFQTVPDPGFEAILLASKLSVIPVVNKLGVFIYTFNICLKYNIFVEGS
jgi:hypothetical protein